MTDATQITKAELLKRMEEQYNTYEQHFSKLSEAQLTEPTDAADW
jgi:hypothetical protein